MVRRQVRVSLPGTHGLSVLSRSQRVAMILTHANHSFVNACRASPSKRFCVADCEAGQLHCKPLQLAIKTLQNDPGASAAIAHLRPLDAPAGGRTHATLLWSMNRSETSSRWRTPWCAICRREMRGTSGPAQLRPDVHLDRGAWDGADALDLQRVSGCGLLALFYGGAFTRGDFLSINGDPGDEAWPVRRSLLGDNAVRRPEPVCLQSLLQERLPITQLVRIHLRRVEDLIQRPEDQIPVYKVGPPDNGLYRIGNDRVVYDGALDVLLYALAPAYRCEERLPYQMGPDTREVPLE